MTEFPTVDYVDGEMIVTHQTGHVDNYTEAELETIKGFAQQSVNDANDNLIGVNTHIANVQLSRAG